MRLTTISRASLDRARRRVARELAQHGFWVERIAEVEVTLGVVPRWSTYGYFDGAIVIPRITATRVWEAAFGGGYVSLADVLRHEYAHAVADRFRGLVRSRVFRAAFGASHDAAVAAEYDPRVHMTPYAATSPSEDFAETFMAFHRHGGELPARNAGGSVRRKWRFVRALGAAVALGRRWPGHPRR